MLLCNKDRQKATKVGGDQFQFDYLVKATVRPALPEDFQLSHLLQADMRLDSEIRPR